MSVFAQLPEDVVKGPRYVAWEKVGATDAVNIIFRPSSWALEMILEYSRRVSSRQLGCADYYIHSINSTPACLYDGYPCPKRPVTSPRAQMLTATPRAAAKPELDETEEEKSM